MKQIKVIFITCELLAVISLAALAYTHCDFTIASLISVLAVWAVACQKEQQSIEWEDRDYVESV